MATVTYGHDVPAMNQSMNLRSMDLSESMFLDKKIEKYQGRTSGGAAKLAAKQAEESRIKRSRDQLRKINTRVNMTLASFEEGEELDLGGDFNDVLMDRLLDDFSSQATLRQQTLSNLDDWFSNTQNADEKERAAQSLSADGVPPEEVDLPPFKQEIEKVMAPFAARRRALHASYKRFLECVQPAQEELKDIKVHLDALLEQQHGLE